MVMLRSPGPLNLVDTLDGSVGLENINLDGGDKDRAVRADLGAGLERVLVDEGDIPETGAIRAGEEGRQGLRVDTAEAIGALRPGSTAHSIVGSQQSRIAKLAVGDV